MRWIEMMNVDDLKFDTIQEKHHEERITTDGT